MREGEEEQPINVLFAVRAPLFTSRVEVLVGVVRSS